MPYFDEFAKSFTSVFSPPVKRPTQLINELPQTCVQIPDEWLQYLIGMVEVMRHEDFWQGTPAQKTNMVKQAEALIERFSVGSPCQEVSIIMGVRVGQVIDGFWNSCPAGSLPLDGSDYDQNDYPALVAVLQENTSLWTSIGDQPISGRFTLPDFSVAVAIGVGQRSEPHAGKPTAVASLKVGDTGGEMKHQLVVDELPTHSHPSPDQSTGYRVRDLSSPNSEIGASDVNSALSDDTGETGDDEPHNNLPPYIAVRKCIVYDIEEYSTMFKLRQSPDDNCVLEQTLDGEIWTKAFDFGECVQPTNTVINIIYSNEITNDIDEVTNIYDGTVESIDPDLVYGDNEDENRNYGLCIGLYIFVQACGELAEEILRENYNDTSDLFDNIGDILGRVGAALVNVPAVSPVTTFLKALGGALIGAGTGAELVALIFDIRAELVNWGDKDLAEDLACCVYDQLKDATVTPASWAYAWGSCAPEGTGDSYWLHRIVNLVATQTDSFLLFLKGWGEMLDLAQTGAVLPCPCEDDICETTNFENNSGSWSPNEGTIWRPGVGYQHPYPVPADIENDGKHCAIIHSLPLGLTLTKVKVVWQSPRDDNGVGCTIQIINAAENADTLIFDNEKTEDALIETVWTGSKLISVGDYLRVLVDKSSVTEKPGIIKQVQFCYEVLA